MFRRKQKNTALACRSGLSRPLGGGHWRIPASKPWAQVIIVIVFGFFRLVLLAGSDEERIWLDAKVNGKKARLCFDSGSDGLILFREGALRLGLRYSEPKTGLILPPGQVPRGLTEECHLSLEGTEQTERFDVVNFPTYRSVDFDGYVGWMVVRNNILEIDAAARRLKCLSEVPKRTADWLQLQVVRDTGFLMLEIPHGNGPNGILGIDTGSSEGVELPTGNWLSWRELHPRAPTTLDALITLGGLAVKEQAWANELTIGSLALTGVSVSEATPMEVALSGTNYEAELGLEALKRVDLIVDGRHGVAYLRAKKTASSSFRYNRLGAVFIPNGTAGSVLAARVIKGSPAQVVGIQEGDILLKINGENITRANYHGYDRFSAHAGTKLKFTLSRNGVTFNTTAILRDIIEPITVIDKGSYISAHK
jgi:PDZ domain/Aspartyl protease